MKKEIIAILLLALFSGCATTSSFSHLSPEEKELKRETGEFRLDTNTRLTGVGYRLLASLPQTDKSERYAYLPFAWSDIDPTLRMTYGKGGVMVAGPIEGITPQDLDVQRGDIILLVDGLEIRNMGTLENLLMSLRDHNWVTVHFKRGEEVQDVRVPILYFPELTLFFVSPELKDVYSAVSEFGDVVVSAPLLHFVENDDELAFLLGHELGHLKGKGFTLYMRKNKKDRRGSAIAMKLGAFVGEYAAAGRLNFDQSKASLDPGRHFLGEEVNADKYAIELMKGAGYQPEAGIKVLERLAVEISTKLGDYVNQQSGTLERAMNVQHPLNEDRIIMLRRHVDELADREGGSAPTAPIQIKTLQDDLLGVASGEEFVRDKGLTKIGLTDNAVGTYTQLDSFSPKLTFAKDTAKIYWFAFYNSVLSVGEAFKMPKYEIKWYAPDGSLYHRENFRARGGYGTSVAKLNLKKLDPAARIGRWRVRVFKQGKLFDDRYFRIG
ncbi:MAG: M48 family metalloprotease [Candidatus Omnitrophica bacterium]|nr:M48 family metalloprotease [Candidatus Omnitrophota bacterium]